VTDLHERGVEKEVALVVWGEFGRTPRINKNGGRDHWAPAGSVLLAGGGLRLGQVLGDTGPRAERARGEPFTAQNILATIYHVLGVNPCAYLSDYTGRPIAVLDDPKPIAELV
jgi:uncharacterized protein (DUF1501 family)